MNKDEFERSLVDFEAKIRKRLPSVIGAHLANKGNRDFEASFTHLVEALDRQRRLLLQDLSRVARLEQRVRYFNAVSAMDAQLRSMGNREALKDQLRLRRRRVRVPVVYDLGSGPESGELLNAQGLGVVIETSGKVPVESEITIELQGKKARGRAMWSVAGRCGPAETGVALVSPSEEFVEEVERHIEAMEAGGGDPLD